MTWLLWIVVAVFVPLGLFCLGRLFARQAEEREIRMNREAMFRRMHRIGAIVKQTRGNRDE